MEGTKRIKSLSKHDCKIIIISETLNESLYEIEGKNNPIILIRRKIRDTNILDEFNDIFVVFASTNDPSLNKKIIDKAREKGILSYSIDDAAASDFFFTSIINIDEVLQVAISTSGKSPLMSKIIRDRIENAIKNIIGKVGIIEQVGRRIVKVVVVFGSKPKYLQTKLNHIRPIVV